MRSACICALICLIVLFSTFGCRFAEQDSSSIEHESEELEAIPHRGSIIVHFCTYEGGTEMLAVEGWDRAWLLGLNDQLSEIQIQEAASLMDGVDDPRFSCAVLLPEIQRKR